jgi:uncharacterized protein (UPF0179 family)
MGNSPFINTFINAVLERLVETDQESKKKFETGARLFDFVPGDYVECSYRKGLFKVYGINKDKLLVVEVTEQKLKNTTQEVLELSPKFVKLSNLDSNWVKALYDTK